MPEKLPFYRDLPPVEVFGRSYRSAWGVFGADDELGTWNTVTPERALAAAKLVQSGRRFALDLPLNEPDPPLFHFRHAYRHVIEECSRGLNVSYDDHLEGFFPQTSTQWDGLRHVCTPTHFYNGRPHAEVLAPGSQTLGVQRLVSHGLVTRGVLLDVERHLSSQGRAIAYDGEPFEFSVDDLMQTARAQGVEIRTGDVLLFRTGFLRWLRQAPRETREALARDLKAPGLQPDGGVGEYLWDLHVAAIASDTVAVERWPFVPQRGFLHFQLITFFGMTLGELWWLDDLAQDCARDGRWDFMLVSVPLHVPGGVGSPPNAIAVK
jgi:hypothetical protein